MNRAISTLVLPCLAGVVLLCGCGGRAAKSAGVAPAESKPVPRVPTFEDKPIDQTLVAAARAELEKQLASSEPIARAHAIEGFRYAGDATASKKIITGLSDPHQLVRFAAAMAIGELKLLDAKPALQGHLEDSDGRVRVAVRFALHRMGDFTHSRDLEKTATDPDPRGWVAGTTAMVLGRLGEPSGAKILRPLMNDARPAVRQQAQEALMLLGDENGRNVIIALLSSGHPDDAMLGLQALTAAGDKRLRVYAYQHLTHEYPEVALVAARAMGAMGGTDGAGVAILAVKATDARQRALAAAAFGEIGRSDSQNALRILLKDKDAEVRVAAATAILRVAASPKRYSSTGDLIP